MATKTVKKTTAKTVKKTTAKKTDTQFEQLLSEITKVSERLDRLEAAPKVITMPEIIPEISPTEKGQVTIIPDGWEFLQSEAKQQPPTPTYTAKPETMTKYYFLIIVMVLWLTFCFFCRAPITGQSELTTFVKQQSQTIPSEYRKEIKTIMRESYQSTAEAIQSRQIVTTSDARTRLSQLLQAKILSLNRLTKNPQELETITQTMKPISDAIGDRLASDVDAGKMKDNLNDVAKTFIEIANGFK
jgi:hypothetical protein